jgi:hypothetical protein
MDAVPECTGELGVSKRNKKRAPPRFRRLAPGQIWRVQKKRGHPVLTAEIDEVTQETVMVRWADDGAIQVKSDALPLRYARADLKFLEKVA